MADQQTSDPASHRPTKAEMEKPVAVDATLDELGKAVTRGGARSRPETKTSRPS